MASESSHVVGLPYIEAGIDDEFLDSSVANDTDFVCPIHGRASKVTEKLRRRGKNNSSSGESGHLKILCFGKSNFNRKLKEHGLRTQKKSTTQIAPMATTLDGTEKSAKISSFTITELSQLNVEELALLKRSIREKISFCDEYLKHLRKEQEHFVCGQTTLKEKAGTLEQTAKEVFQPWVHFLPHSDEMTRALMLN